jgi:peptidoglycan-associated lipoprotein
MYKLLSSRVVIGVVSAVFAVMLALSLPAAAQGDDEGPNGETATELLIDGMDAAADHAVDSARRLFQKLISLFPASPEASRARRALSTLGSDGDTDEDRAAIRADEAERTAEYRHAFLLSAGDRVFFAESSAELGGRALAIIKSQARWLKLRPDLAVTVIGRSDDGGDRHAAQLLSAQRAEAVRDRLIAAGLDAGRIGLRPTGNDDKVAICSTSLCRAQNRNAEVFINDLRDQDPIRSSMQSLPVRPSNTSLERGAETGRVAQ